MFPAGGTAWEKTELREGAAPARGESKLDTRLRKWAAPVRKACVLCRRAEGGVPAGFRVRAEKGGGHGACGEEDMRASSRQEERGPLSVRVHFLEEV